MTSSAIQFIDLSHPLTSSTQTYPSDPTFSSTPHATHEKDGYAVQRLSLGTHTGTHIDAPYHFLANGKTVEDIPLSQVVGEAVVIDLSQSAGLKERERIEWAQLEPYAQFIPPGRIVLINTGWSKRHYQTPTYLAHPYLAPQIARELLMRGVRVVGTDTLNPDETPSAEGECEGKDGFGFHETFLGAGAVIAENLTNLEELVEAQTAAGTSKKWVVCLVPLKLIGADGSPVRAFAYSESR